MQGLVKGLVKTVEKINAGKNTQEWKIFFSSCTSWLQAEEALSSKNVEFIAAEKAQRDHAIYNFVIVSFVTLDLRRWAAELR